MRSLKLIYVHVLLITGLSVSAQSDEVLAMKKYELGDYDAAIESYQAVLAVNPDNQEAMIRLAESMRMKGMLNEAVDWYGKVADMQKPAKQFIFNYAKCLQELGYYREAKNWFLKYAEVDPVKGRHFAISCDYAMQHDLRSDLAVEITPVANADNMNAWPVLNGHNLIYWTNDPGYCRSERTSEWINVPVRKWKSLQNVSYIRSEIQDCQNTGPISYNKTLGIVAITSIAGQNHNFELNPRESFGIYVGDVTNNNNWENVKPFPFNVSGYSTGYPAWSEDDGALYFASNRPGGFGGYDIYISYYENGQWTYPQNMGDKINTPGDEISPFFQDGTLYFSSDWHPGFGGFDIFSSDMNGFAYSTPINLGLPVNSSVNDWGIQMDPTHTFGFLSSDRSKYRSSSVYHVQMLHESALMVSSPESDRRIPVAQAIQMELPGTVISTQAKNDLVQFTSYTNVDKAVSENQNDIIKSLSLTPTFDKKLNVEQDQRFFIQVAALSKYKENLEQFRPLAEYGHVYRVDVNGIAKIRIGQFRSMGEAVEALKVIKKSGFQDAYIVQDYVDPATLDLLITATTGSNTPSASNGTVAPKPNGETVKSYLSGAQKTYKVRLTAYHYNTQFDTRSVSDLGEIEQWTKGSWKIILIGGYNELSKAKTALSKAKERGFVDAYIVIEEDGLLLPYEEK